MVVSTEDIEKLCKGIAHDVHDVYDDLHLHFVVHQTGKTRDSIALAEHRINSYPAAEAAQSILRKQIQNDSSSFLGLAIATKTKFFGFKRIDNVLGLFNVNSDQFKTLEQAEMEINQLSWHAIDLHEIRKNPVYRQKFKKGAMIPKRSPLNLSKSNLQADAYFCILDALKGRKNTTKKLALKRAEQSLTPITHFKSEDYPFVIAMEASDMAIEEALENRNSSQNNILAARKISVDIGHAFDEESIKQWWEYALPAQDMAWRGISQENILGAALNTSNNPFVRSTAYLINEILGDVEATDAEDLVNSYNAFLDTGAILDLHREMVDAAFEEAITKGLRDSSPEAFMKAANEQNEHLTEGRILGWCANALQNAGKAFDSALKSGTAPDQAARLTFDTRADTPSWDSLKNLGKKIVEEKREGFAVTMGHIAEVCHNNPAFSQVLDSIKITMNDPSYLQKLEAANDLNFIPTGPAMNAPAPKGPAPNAPGPKGPQLSGPAATPTPMPAPGMGGPGGGNNRSAQIMHQKRMMAEKYKQEQAAQDRKRETDNE